MRNYYFYKKSCQVNKKQHKQTGLVYSSTKNSAICSLGFFLSFLLKLSRFSRKVFL